MKRLIQSEKDLTPDRLYNIFSNIYPEIQKGQYIGTMRAHDCDKNSMKVFKQEGLDVYIGYALFYDKSYDDWRYAGHVFNVKNGVVIEYTDLYPLNFNDVYYFGEKVENPKLKGIFDKINSNIFK